MTIIRSFPRIHLGLIDLGNVTLRKYGGAGFTLTGPTIETEATSDDVKCVIGDDILDSRARDDIHSALDRLRVVFPNTNAKIKIKNIPPQHIGLGTKTSVILNVLVSATMAAGITPETKTIQNISERGGTSGIGINSFFTGGFVIDGGHNPRLSPGFAPSSVNKISELPPVICQANIPTDWEFHLLIPRGEKRSGINEAQFFTENTPIPKIEVYETLGYIYHGVAPAVCTDDLPLLKSSVAALQRIGFKGREVKNQPGLAQRILNKFEEIQNCAVGLSSMGPLVYIISKNDNHEVAKLIKDILSREDVTFLGVYNGQNRGYEVLENDTVRSS